MRGRTRQGLRQAETVALASPSAAVLRLRVPAGAERRHAGLMGGEKAAPIYGDVATIGRGLQNSVVLLDPAVSREHARLVRSGESWRVVNTSERIPLRAGTRELQPGESAELALGETLTLGSTALQLLAPYANALEGAGHEAAGGTGASGPLAPGSSGAGATRLMGPGITLQFAINGERHPRAWWLAGALATAVFVVCAVITVGTAALVGRSALAEAGVGQVLAALTIPLVPVLGVSALVAAIDRYEREPWILLLGAFLWGAVIAIPPVLVVEHALDAVLAGGPGGALAHAGALAAVASVSEEVFKGAGLLLLLVTLRDEFDNVTDGILYGMLIGAGFAMVENFVYFAVSPRGDLGFLILGRVVLGWLSHSTFTALVGAGLGYARETHARGWRWLAPLCGLAAAVVLHMLFDFVAFAATALAREGLAAASPGMFGLVTLVAAYGPLFATQAVLLRIVLAALRREAEVVRAYLAAEVLSGVVSPDEYILVQNAALRGLAERRTLVAYGPRAYLTARALYQTATGLAFRRWHVAMGDPLKPTERQPEDAYRERIGRLRRSLARQMAATEEGAEAGAGGTPT